MAKKKSAGKKKKTSAKNSNKKLAKQEKTESSNADDSIISSAYKFSASWVKSHELLGLDLLMFESTGPGEKHYVGSTDDPKLGTTLANAMRIYVELFYIMFAEEVADLDILKSSKHWEFETFNKCVDLAFNTLISLCKIPGYRLAVMDPVEYEVIPEGQSISSLIVKPAYLNQIIPFVSVIYTALKGASPAIDENVVSDAFSFVNSTEELIGSFSWHIEIQALRELLRYLQPHESKALLNTIAFSVLKLPGAEENPFTYTNLVDNCLSNSLYRSRLLTQTPNITPQNLVVGIMTADDMEFWNRLKLTKAKLDHTAYATKTLSISFAEASKR